MVGVRIQYEVSDSQFPFLFSFLWLILSLPRPNLPLATTNHHLLTSVPPSPNHQGTWYTCSTSTGFYYDASNLLHALVTCTTGLWVITENCLKHVCDTTAGTGMTGPAPAWDRIALLNEYTNYPATISFSVQPSWPSARVNLVILYNEISGL